MRARPPMTTTLHHGCANVTVVSPPPLPEPAVPRAAEDDLAKDDLAKDDLALLEVGQGRHRAEPPPCPESLSLLEVGAQAGAQAGAGGDNNLHCSCEEYACHCQKECFCRFASDPFNGIQYPPEANCPVCKYCGPNQGGGEDDEKAHKKNAPSKTPLKDHDFKCTCALEGIGGPGISDGGSMTCDCRLADCTCDKKCSCHQPPKPTAPLACKDPVIKPQKEVAPEAMGDIMAARPHAVETNVNPSLMKPSLMETAAHEEDQTRGGEGTRVEGPRVGAGGDLAPQTAGRRRRAVREGRQGVLIPDG